MTTDRARERCRERLRLLGSARLERDEFAHEVVGVLRQAIGFDGPTCWALADPASLLPVGHEITGADAALYASVPRLTALHQGHEAASDRAAAGGELPAATLSGSTGGDLARNQLWDECFRPNGVGDCFFLACRDRHGCWGWLNASRGSSDPPYTAEDARLLNDVSASVGATLRGLMTGDSAVPATSPPPGVIVCDRHLREVGWSPSAREWIARFPDGPLFRSHGLLPPVVYGVAGRLLAAGDGTPPGAARARVRTSAGGWAVVDGQPLEGDAAGRIALTIRAATAEEVVGLLCRVHALTPRERELVRLVVEGLNTRQVAERLFITPYTVKDHLKAVFDKVGVRSRGQLVRRMTGQTVGP